MEARRAVAETSIWSIEDIDATASTELRVVADWLLSYVNKPHPRLGRSGVVCPFVPPALRLKTVWLTLVNDVPSRHDEVCDALRIYLQLYLSLASADDAKKEYATLTVIFGDMTLEEAITLVPDVHQTLKPEIVDHGLMLGEFHALNDAPGLHNPSFKPLRSPIPLFVFRQMVANDLAFLAKPSDPPALRGRFVRTYLRHLGPTLAPERVRQAEEAIATADREMVIAACPATPAVE